MSKLKQEINKEKILKALEAVIDKETGLDVVTAGIISSIVVKGDTIGFAIEIDINKASRKEDLRKECEEAVKAIEGVQRVTAVLTSSKPGILHETATPNKAEQSSTLPVGKNIPGVKNIILVASGKGGVGKSTVAVNLARSLIRAGNSVGLLDADIYGPSIPKMLGLTGKPDIDGENRMIPKEAFGIKSVSIGYLVEDDTAVIWRSSMALKAMNQLFRGVAWGNLDYLIVDTPPGTGDIQLSLAKNYAISGVILVSTPQDTALIDVKKAANMFRKLDTPIFGVVENMSYFEDQSGRKNYIFGEGSVKKFAEEENIPFLGEIPLKSEIREAMDLGLELSNTLVIDKITLKFKKELERHYGE